MYKKSFTRTGTFVGEQHSSSSMKDSLRVKTDMVKQSMAERATPASKARKIATEPLGLQQLEDKRSKTPNNASVYSGSGPQSRN